MKHLRSYNESFEDIKSICRQYDITNYTINSDGSIDVDDNVRLNRYGLTKLPLNFNKVSGYFLCSDNHQLTSLLGSPKVVGGGFDCSNNKLTSLVGGPTKVGGHFYCSDNELTSLEGSPKEVVGSFNCSHNKLTTLEGGPKEVGYLYCYNNELTSLKGAPKVGGSFDYYNNPLPTEILYNHEYIKEILYNQDIYSIWKADGTLDLYRFNQMMAEILGEEDKDI